MKLTFQGAARTVTGSMHHLEAQGKRILLDCGLYQGRRKEAFEKNKNFPFAPSSIDAVLLSHAHIDHSGNLPNLVDGGFAGRIFTSEATAALCRPMLLDSAFIQEKDIEFLMKRRSRRRMLDQQDEGPLPEPLYTVEDAERTLTRFTTLAMHERHEIAPGVTYESFEAGHMLGSTAMVVRAEGIALAFSGDVGRPGLPIIRDPEALPPVDYLIMECTYGDRLHEDMGNVEDKLAATITRTCNRGGRIIVPAFAVGRTQQLVVLLNDLMERERIPSIPIFVDSPLAVNVTEVFREHRDLFDAETTAFFDRGRDPFGFSRLRYVRDVSESKAINALRGPLIVISASGMCEAGRILHHLRNNISDARNTVLITGFQAEHTLGRKLVEREPEVNIFGEPHRVRAEVVKLNELSGHADQRELIEWMKPMMKSAKRVFLVHGEERQAEALRALALETYGVEVAVPARGQSFHLQTVAHSSALGRR